MGNASQKKLSSLEAKFRPYQNWRRSPQRGLADYGNFTVIIRHYDTNLCPCGIFFHYPTCGQSSYWARERMAAIYRHLREHELRGEFIWMMEGRIHPKDLSAELDYLRSQYPGARVRAFVHWTPGPKYRGPINVVRHRRRFFPRRSLNQEGIKKEEEPEPRQSSLQTIAQSSQGGNIARDVPASHGRPSETQAPPQLRGRKQVNPPVGSEFNAIIIEDDDEDEEQDEDDEEVEFTGFNPGSALAGAKEAISAPPQLIKKEEEDDDSLALQIVDKVCQSQAMTSNFTKTCTETENIIQDLVNRGEALIMNARLQRRHAQREDPMELSLEYGEDEDEVEERAQA